MSEMDSHFQALHAMVLNNYGHGGIDACRNMLDDMTREVEFMGIVAVEAERAKREIGRQRGKINSEEANLRIELAAGIDQDREHAVDKRNYVGRVVLQIEEITTDYPTRDR